MTKPIGLQLFTLREQLGASRQAFLDTLKLVADIGFKGIEGGSGAKFGISTQEYKSIADDLGLAFTNAPGLNRDLSNVQETLDTAALLEVDLLWLGFGREDFADLDAIKRSADTTNAMLDALQGTGLQIAMHNHWWEYAEVEGRLGIDYLADWCPGVQFEIDLYWACNFGANKAADQVARFRDRLPLIHAKDGTLETDGTPMGPPMVPVGSGNVDLAEAIGAANPEVLRWIIVEIDRCDLDMVEAVKQSYRYLTENGLAEGTQ